MRYPTYPHRHIHVAKIRALEDAAAALAETPDVATTHAEMAAWLRTRADHMRPRPVPPAT